MPSDGCIFCAILAGDAPAHRVHEDERTLVFMDLFPVADGHTLVIPKAHVENIFEIDADHVAACARMSRRIAHAIRSVLSPDGVAVVQANGAAAGQTVFHYHTHLIPAWTGTPLQLHGRQQGDATRLAEVAGQLATALSAAW